MKMDSLDSLTHGGVEGGLITRPSDRAQRKRIIKIL